MSNYVSVKSAQQTRQEHYVLAAANEIQSFKWSRNATLREPVLLFVVLDNFGGPLFRLVGIFPEFLERAALSQQIPILVELHF
jgi:hypothetical protein